MLQRSYTIEHNALAKASAIVDRARKGSKLNNTLKLSISPGWLTLDVIGSNLACRVTVPLLSDDEEVFDYKVDILTDLEFSLSDIVGICEEDITAIVLENALVLKTTKYEYKIFSDENCYDFEILQYSTEGMQELVQGYSMSTVRALSSLTKYILKTNQNFISENNVLYYREPTMWAEIPGLSVNCTINAGVLKFISELGKPVMYKVVDNNLILKTNTAYVVLTVEDIPLYTEIKDIIADYEMLGVTNFTGIKAAIDNFKMLTDDTIITVEFFKTGIQLTNQASLAALKVSTARQTYDSEKLATVEVLFKILKTFAAVFDNDSEVVIRERKEAICLQHQNKSLIFSKN